MASTMDNELLSNDVNDGESKHHGDTAARLLPVRDDAASASDTASDAGSDSSFELVDAGTLRDAAADLLPSDDGSCDLDSASSSSSAAAASCSLRRGQCTTSRDHDATNSIRAPSPVARPAHTMDVTWVAEATVADATSKIVRVSNLDPALSVRAATAYLRATYGRHGGIAATYVARGETLPNAGWGELTFLEVASAAAARTEVGEQVTHQPTTCTKTTVHTRNNTHVHFVVFLVVLAVLHTYALVNGEIRASILFTALAAFGQLRFPLLTLEPARSGRRRPGWGARKT